jgi:hypothetical protein
MTTNIKDFRVKNGLRVADGGFFGGRVQIQDASLPNEAVTKLYVDTQVASAVQGVIYKEGGFPDTESFDDVFDGGTPETTSWNALIDSGGVGLASIVGIYPTAPDGGQNGDLYFNTETNRLSVFYNDQWFTLANLADAELQEIPQHIHDTSIDGNGFITTTFVDSGFFFNIEGSLVSAGFFNTESWDKTYDGGIALDNFN